MGEEEARGAVIASTEAMPQAIEPRGIVIGPSNELIPDDVVWLGGSVRDVGASIQPMHEPVYSISGSRFATCTAGWLQPGPVRVFRGVTSGEQDMRVCFRLRDTEFEGSAVLDTGYPDFLIAETFAKRCGLPLDHEAWVEVHGLSDKPRRLPTTSLDVSLIADAGSDLNLTARLIGVGPLPKSVDMLIGRRILSLGVLTLDGPKAGWEWRVDDTKIAHRVAPRLR